jgi:aldehyde dehydrogenase (NAD+)
VQGYVELGKKEGAKMLCGGSRLNQKGFFFESTVFADVEDHMTIAKEEIFGPVMSIIKFKTVEEAIARANNSEYGLAAGVCTSSIDSAIEISNALRTGVVYVNCFMANNAMTPFGGFKNSGIGREMGLEGLRAYTETKTVVIKRPDHAIP